MVFKSLAMVLILSISTNIFAQEIQPAAPILQRTPGKVECDEVNLRCTYLVQNITAKELIARINDNIFPGLSPSEGTFSAENIKKVVFYIKDTTLRARIIALIPLLDVFEDITPSSQVQITTEIYSLSESAASEIQAQATSASATANPADEIAKWVVSSMAGGASVMGAQIATNLLSSILGSKQIKEESSKISTVTQMIPNLAAINYSQNMTIYVAPPGAGVAKEQVAGLTIGGTVSIRASNANEIMIKDYSIRYGVIDPTSQDPALRVNILSVSNPQLLLYKGTSTTLVSTVTTEETNRKEYSFLSFGKTKTKLQNQILIVTRAEAISSEDLINNLKKISSVELHKDFSAEEIAKLPSNEVPMEELLSHIKPYSFFSSSGDRILGFQLKMADARESNINKNIEISVKTGGAFGGNGSLNQKVILSVQNLMLSGLKFDKLSPKDINQQVVKIKLGLKVFNQETAVSKILYYNPETNKFIE